MSNDLNLNEENYKPSKIKFTRQFYSKYFFYKRGEVVGPLTFKQFSKLIAEGKLNGFIKEEITDDVAYKNATDEYDKESKKCYEYLMHDISISMEISTEQADFLWKEASSIYLSFDEVIDVIVREYERIEKFNKLGK